MKMPFPWKIVHLNLQKSLTALKVPENSAGLHVIWWFGDTPLGARYVGREELPLTPGRIKNMAVKAIAPSITKRLKDQTMEGLGVHSPWFMNDTPFCVLDHGPKPLNASQVSVVVCTRNRPHDLRTCLISLKKLSPPPLEIVVVDNAPASHETRQIVSCFKDIGYVHEPRPGLSIARNCGIKNVSGDIVAFTDDDVQVHPRWAARIQQAFHDPDIMAVTGLVIPLCLETEAQVIFEREMNGLGRGFVPRTFNRAFFLSKKKYGFWVWEIGAGANMAFRRKVFHRIGTFDTRLGAGAAGCSEDTELWYRLLSSGATCQYEPGAVVFHRHRAGMVELKQQIKAYLKGHAAALLIQFETHRDWGNLRRLFFQLPRYYTGLLCHACIFGFKGRYRLLFPEVTGFLSGIWFYINQRKEGD